MIERPKAGEGNLKEGAGFNEVTRSHPLNRTQMGMASLLSFPSHSFQKSPRRLGQNVVYVALALGVLVFLAVWAPHATTTLSSAIIDSIDTYIQGSMNLPAPQSMSG